MEEIKVLRFKMLEGCEDLTPRKAGPLEAGFDLFCRESFSISPYSRMVIGTGVHVALPHNTVGLLWSKSGLSAKQGIETGAGCIDETYRGEIKVVLYNHSNDPVSFERGNKITQLLVIPLATVMVQTVNSLDETTRGDGGFGSTGK